MIRRSFIASLTAMLAGLFGVKAVKAAVENRKIPKGGSGTAPPISERDHLGNCLAKLYRLGKDGFYHEIPRDGAKPGERCITIGLDGGRLWKAEAFTVGEGGCIKFEDGTDGIHPEKEVNLFDKTGWLEPESVAWGRKQ